LKSLAKILDGYTNQKLASLIFFSRIAPVQTFSRFFAYNYGIVSVASHPFWTMLELTGFV